MGARQYIRRCNLWVAGVSGAGLDLSGMRIRFSIKKSDAQTPNAAEIVVYNLAPTTARQIRDEFRTVTLQAGYDANFGVIFAGNIKQVRLGRENGTDSYVSIAAGDGDEAYNYAVVSTTLAAGATQRDQVDAAAAAMAPRGVAAGHVDPLGEAALPRGKVMYGMARDYLRQTAQATATTVSVQDGRLQVLSRTGLLPGQAVRLTEATGLVGVPEQTEAGIKARCLLNPMLRVGGRVVIAETDILEAPLAPPAAASSSTTAKPKTPAVIARDGLYRVLVVEYSGDNRGNDWYSDLTCLAADASAPAGQEVDPR